MLNRARLLRALIAAMVALVLILPTSALAADPQTNLAVKAIQLQPSKPLSGSLPGAPATGSSLSNNGAGLAYYKFEYPGDNSNVTINMQVYPDDEALLTDQKIGFVVYGPKSANNPGFIYGNSGEAPKKSPNVSGDFRSQDRGSYLIQVFNDAHAPISYSIWADGLPPQPASAVQAPAPAAPAAAAPTLADAPAPVTAAAPLTGAPAVPPAPFTGVDVDLTKLVPPVSAFGPGWSQKSTSTTGSNSSVKVYAAEYVGGDPANPSAGVIIGLYQSLNDAAREAILPAIRSTFEPQGYTLTAASDYGDRAGLKGSSNKPPVVGLLRAFQVRNVGVAIIVVVSSDKAAEGEKLITALAQGELTAINEAVGIVRGGQTAAAGQTTRLAIGASVKGALDPGQSVLLQVDYPGDESVYTVNEQVDPDDSALLDKAGFQVFQPNGTLQVKGGAQPKLRPNVSADIISAVKGTYTVKVINDNSNAVINFEVSLTAKAPDKK